MQKNVEKEGGNLELSLNHKENKAKKFSKIAVRVNEPYGTIPAYSPKQAFTQASFWLSASGYLGWLKPWSDPRSLIAIDLLWASYLGGNKHAAYELCCLFIQTKSDFDEEKATKIIGITQNDVVLLLIRLAFEGYSLAAKDLDYHFNKKVDRNLLFELLIKNRNSISDIESILSENYSDLLRLL